MHKTAPAITHEVALFTVELVRVRVLRFRYVGGVCFHVMHITALVITHKVTLFTVELVRVRGIRIIVIRG